MSIILKMCFAVFLALFVSVSVESAATGTTTDDNVDSVMATEYSKRNMDTAFVDVRIELAPPSKAFQAAGSSIELECEVGGSPATMHWIRNNNMDDIVDNGESSLITKPSSGAVVRILSRLIIEDSSSTDRTFTCVGRSGDKTVSSSTTIHTVPVDTAEVPSPNHGAKKPRIVFYYKTFLDIIGQSVELPCIAADRPNTKIQWMDTNKKDVDGLNGRFSVLPSGSLHISHLLWEDMGDYTCQAKNDLGEDSITTFLYPAARGQTKK